MGPGVRGPARRGRSAAALGLILAAGIARAGVAPFHTADRAAFARVHALPPAEAGSLVPPGALDARVVLEVSNQFAPDATATETIALDGETQTVVLALRYGVAPAWEAGLDIPYVAHNGGVLDGFIDGWHRVTGLPGHGRADADHGLVRYTHETSGRDPAGIDGPACGPGDVQVSVARQIARSPRGRAAALRATLQLPTGRSRDLLGSGAPELALRVTAEDTGTLARLGLAGYAGLGVLWMAPGEVLPDRQRRVAWLATLGAEWAVLDRLVLRVQADGHSALYRSGLRPLGSGSLQLFMGGSIGLPGGTWLDLGVGEDVYVDSAPDTTFHAAVRRRF